MIEYIYSWELFLIASQRPAHLVWSIVGSAIGHIPSPTGWAVAGWKLPPGKGTHRKQRNLKETQGIGLRKLLENAHTFIGYVSSCISITDRWYGHWLLKTETTIKMPIFPAQQKRLQHSPSFAFMAVLKTPLLSLPCCYCHFPNKASYWQVLAKLHICVNPSWLWLLPDLVGGVQHIPSPPKYKKGLLQTLHCFQSLDKYPHKLRRQSVTMTGTYFSIIWPWLKRICYISCSQASGSTR